MTTNVMRYIRSKDLWRTPNYHWMKQIFPAHTIPCRVHDHDFFEFLYICSGEALHHINGQTFTLCPGDLRLIFPEDVHQLIPSQNSSVSLELYNCNIRREEFYEQFWRLVNKGNIAPDDLSRAIKLTDAVQSSAFLHKLDAIFSMQLNSHCLSFVIDAHSRGLLGDVFCLLLQRTVSDNHNWPDWFEHMIQQMQQEKNFLGGVPRMVELSGRSLAYLDRTLRRYYGISPREFILEKKLNYAAFLITYQNIPITQAILRVGFSNFSYFRRCFVQRYGMLPKEYRQKMGQSSG